MANTPISFLKFGSTNYQFNDKNALHKSLGYLINGKNYPVQDSGGKLYVNVPWTDTTYGASTGLDLSGTAFSLKPAAGDELGGIKIGYGDAFVDGKYKFGVSLTDDSHIANYQCAYVGIPLVGQNSAIAGLMTSLDKSKLDNMPNSVIGQTIDKTWSQLKTLRDNSNLIPGQWYRITDYVTTTAQGNTQSAGHQFDIIVRADNTNVLNENAYAALHSGDTYFANSNLETWELKYCLDNDTNHFAWADSTNGKGVIYFMKDEFANECPYDFKNIQFKRWKTTGSANLASFNGTYLGGKDLMGDSYPDGVTLNDNDTKYFFTFSKCGSNYSTIEDGTVAYGDTTPPFNNTIKVNYDSWGDYVAMNTFFLNDLVYEYDSFAPYGNHLGTNCYFNTFGNNCANNSFGNNCTNNSFGNSCFNISFENSCINNSFGNNCSAYSFGNNCSGNSFGNRCTDNSFGNNCQYNSFGNYCQYNSFGNNCLGHLFEYYCNNNSFGNYCIDNSFGNYCQYNSFGNYCQNNSFGNNCLSNFFGNSCLHITFAKDYCYYNIIENGNQYITLTSTQTTSSSLKLQNITIAQGVNNTTTMKIISHNTVNDTFQTEYKPINSEIKTV